MFAVLLSDFATYIYLHTHIVTFADVYLYIYIYIQPTRFYKSYYNIIVVYFYKILLTYGVSAIREHKLHNIIHRL
jgi:hypothetical protein